MYVGAVCGRHLVKRDEPHRSGLLQKLLVVGLLLRVGRRDETAEDLRDVFARLDRRHLGRLGLTPHVLRHQGLRAGGVVLEQQLVVLLLVPGDRKAKALS